MHVLIAPDKFKNSLTSFEVCAAIAQGWRHVFPDAQVTECPLADGGDGWAAVALHYAGAKEHKAVVADPLMRPVPARFAVSADGGTAFVEMAQASGLWRLHPSEYDCTRTSSYGTGQLLLQAAQLGVQQIILGIGGSATNDGGMGMAAALGYLFLDAAGNELAPIGQNLGFVSRIEFPQTSPLENIQVRVAYDVSNPLLGASGAAHVFAPQKGATPEQVNLLEKGMETLATVIRKQMGVELRSIEGGGAAGGFGAGAVAFLGAQLVQGTSLVLQLAGLAPKMGAATVVITGEGKMDMQTLRGKLVSGVAALAKQEKKPLLALCGILDLEPGHLESLGIRCALPLVGNGLTETEALQNAIALLTRRASELAMFWKEHGSALSQKG